jgi:hypothetical protein
MNKGMDPSKDLIKIAFDYAFSNSLTVSQKNCLKHINDQDLGMLNSIGLGSFYAYIIQKLSIKCDSEIESLLISLSLTAQYLASCRKNDLMEVKRNFNGVYLLKGMSIIDVYPKDWIRLMGDVDLLVPSSEIATISALLAQLGYKQRSTYSPEFYDNMHHLMPFYDPNSAVWIEVHTGIFPGHIQPESECFEPGYFFSHSEKVGWEEGSCLRPTVELNLVYIMTHWVIEFRVVDSANQLLDVLYLVKHYKDEIDWHKFLSLINDRTTATCVYICMIYFRNHGINLADQSVYSALGNKDRSIGGIGEKILLIIIETCFKRNKWPLGWLGTNNLSIIWSALIANRSISVNYYYAMKNIVFPPEHEKRYSPSFQLERLFRIFK